MQNSFVQIPVCTVVENGNYMEFILRAECACGCEYATTGRMRLDEPEAPKMFYQRQIVAIDQLRSWLKNDLHGEPRNEMAIIIRDAL